MSKRYYWLKLKESFFEREEIKVIENMKNGKDYIIFYMKLLLKSVSTEGRLMFRNVIPYTPEMLASITNTSVDTVKVAIDLFVKLGLMELWDDGALFMVETQNMIGSETDSAARMRKMRAVKELTTSQCDRNVLKSYTDIEIDKDTDIDKDIEIEKESPIPYTEIKDLYNSICVSLPKVQSLSSNRRQHLKARWTQFSGNIETFKQVFNKVENSKFCKGNNDRGWKADFDWLIKNDSNMLKVLEGKYDNKENPRGPSPPNAKQTRFHTKEQRTANYTPEELEAIARKRRQ